MLDTLDTLTAVMDTVVTVVTDPIILDQWNLGT